MGNCVIYGGGVKKHAIWRVGRVVVGSKTLIVKAQEKKREEKKIPHTWPHSNSQILFIHLIKTAQLVTDGLRVKELFLRFQFICTKTVGRLDSPRVNMVDNKGQDPCAITPRSCRPMNSRKTQMQSAAQ